MDKHDKIIIRGLHQNNLKNISIDIPKNKIIVFTGVSGSGKSSIVFDTIAAESQRQMNETYTAFARGRLPKFEKPNVELIENLTPSVIVDQSRLGGNIRSTVGTISDMYASLRLLFSRIGTPWAGTSSYFSFNDPNGMCPTCSGIGYITEIDLNALIDINKSLNEGCVNDKMFSPKSWYWEQYANSKLFDLDKKIKDYSQEEYNLLIYGSRKRDGKQEDKHVPGLFNQYSRYLVKRDISDMSEHTKNKSQNLIKESLCPDCQGKRLNKKSLECKILGYSIYDMCEMEFCELKEVLGKITNPSALTIVKSLTDSLDRMIEIGLPYLNMNRESSTLSGGEAQRLKLVRYMGSSLTGMTYIFDEPSTGLHPRDVYRMNELLIKLKEKGNTVLVVEHDSDVIKIADEIIDIGPLAGSNGGEIQFQGTFEQLLTSETLTSKAMRLCSKPKSNVRTPKSFYEVVNANLHNLKNVSVLIPKGVMSVITGVAGSGKSSLISGVFAKQFEDQVVMVDQGPITATNRSMPATFLGFFDEIRNLFAKTNNVDASLFSFNSDGACPKCKGKGVVVTELVFMDPVVTTCEECGGSRYNKEALSYYYKNKSIVEVLNMTARDAFEFFEDESIKKHIGAMIKVGLSYLTLGQPTSTLSGGERQRLKLAKYLDKKGNIYILDEPTTGLHATDVDKLLKLFDTLVEKGNTVIVIEHNMEVMKYADYIIDVGPDGGKEGGEIVFCGTIQQMLETSNTITAKCLRKNLNLPNLE